MEKSGKVMGPEMQLNRWGSCPGRKPSLTHGMCGSGQAQDSPAAEVSFSSKQSSQLLLKKKYGHFISVFWVERLPHRLYPSIC